MNYVTFIWFTIISVLDAHAGAITALATIFIAAFTIALAFSTRRLWKSTEKSIDLAKDEFNAAHRPKLIVRRIAALVEGGMPVGIRYAVHNIGDNAGTIVAVSNRIWLPTQAENLPAIPPYSESVAHNIILERGDWKELTHVMPTELCGELAFVLGFTQTHQNRALKRYEIDVEEPMLFLGYIDYVDRVGTKRQTAFLRSFDFKTERFNPINHPEYEYQD